MECLKPMKSKPQMYASTLAKFAGLNEADKKQCFQLIVADNGQIKRAIQLMKNIKVEQNFNIFCKNAQIVPEDEAQHSELLSLKDKYINILSNNIFTVNKLINKNGKYAENAFQLEKELESLKNIFAKASETITADNWSNKSDYAAIKIKGNFFYP